jgi:hypothetical protein
MVRFFKRWWTACAVFIGLVLAGWALFHPEFRPDPQTVSAAVRAELAKTGFKSTQGVSAAEFVTHESVDGMGEEGRSRQLIVPVDAVLTEKRTRRQWKGAQEQVSGLYAGPLTALRFDRGWPPLIGDLIPYALWSSTRLTEFAIEERHEFPHASGGRLVARATYEERYADGELIQTERVRLRCEVEKLADAASVHAGLAGKAALLRCKGTRESMQPGPKHPGTYAYDDVQYAHWYVLERGWSIALEGGSSFRLNDAPHVRKWRSKLLSFENL